MKKTLLTLFSIIITGFLFAQDCEDLFFSEYCEGSNTNKSLEIYNPTDATISLDDYQMSRYSNGNTSPNYVSFPTGHSVAAHGTYVIVLDKRDPAGTGQDTAVFEDLQSRADTFLCPVYDENKMMYFNGNDAVTLEMKNGTIVDIFAKVGENPGLSWTDDESADFLDTGDWTRYWTKDQTLIRKPGIMKGVTVNPTLFNPTIEWDSLPRNTFTEFGWHVCDCYTDPDQPVFDQSFYEFTIDEGLANGAIIGTVNATDATSQVLSYYFESGNYAYILHVDLDVRHTPFAIDRHSGEITLRDSEGLNKDEWPYFPIIIQATDGTTPATTTVIINYEAGVGVEKVSIQNYNINLFPNPLNGNEFNINSTKSIESIQVFNILGEILQTQTNISGTKASVNIEDISKGLYFVCVEFENHLKLTKKLIVK